MTSYEPPYGSDYLIVRLDVYEEKTSLFQQLMSKVRKEVFEHKLHWKLVRAAKQLTSKGDVRTYLHIWQAPNPINLWEAMYSVGGNSDYAQLHPLIKREQQDIARLAVTYSPIGLLTAPKKRLLLQPVELTQDWFVVQNWCWKLPDLIGSGQASPPNWEFAIALQAQSGQLRRHFHVWQTQDDTIEAPPAWAPEQDAVDTAPDRTNVIRQAVLKRGPVEVYTAIDY